MFLAKLCRYTVSCITRVYPLKVIVLVIWNKKCKEILYLYTFGYSRYQNDKKILKIKQMSAV